MDSHSASESGWTLHLQACAWPALGPGPPDLPEGGTRPSPGTAVATFRRAQILNVELGKRSILCKVFSPSPSTSPFLEAGTGQPGHPPLALAWATGPAGKLPGGALGPAARCWRDGVSCRAGQRLRSAEVLTDAAEGGKITLALC